MENQNYKNPIDKDKVTDSPGTLPYPHTIGSIVIKAEDKGKIKTRALSAMHEQTAMQLGQIQKQVELLLLQANEIKQRVEVSEKIYQADMPFEPLIGKEYHLYEVHGQYRIMLIGPNDWGASKKDYLNFISTVKLQSDHTWTILNDNP